MRCTICATVCSACFACCVLLPLLVPRKKCTVRGRNCKCRGLFGWQDELIVARNTGHRCSPASDTSYLWHRALCCVYNQAQRRRKRHLALTEEVLKAGVVVRRHR
jgi:hypothetical protein